MPGFFTSRLGLAAIVAALVLALLGGSYLKGRGDGAQSVRARNVADAAKTDARTAEVSTTAAQAVATERVRIETVTKTLIRKVPVYVPAAADAACVVNSGLVQFLDRAAQVPSAAGGPVEAPSGVPLSAVAATVAENYGVAYDWRAEALGWRAWYVREAKAWNRR